MNTKDVQYLIAGLPLLALGIWLIVSGWRQYWQGVVPNLLGEYSNSLRWVNFWLVLLGRQPQTRLTKGQIRALAIPTICAGGIFCLVALWELAHFVSILH